MLLHEPFMPTNVIWILILDMDGVFVWVIREMKHTIIITEIMKERTSK
jgi:hypothetical protein